MDVDFLAAGAQLERGAGHPPVAFPSAARLLGQVSEAAAVDPLLAAHRLLRVIEARARWVAAGPVEVLARDPDALALTADLVEPGLGPGELVEQLDQARTVVGAAIDRVIDADSIEAL